MGLSNAGLQSVPAARPQGPSAAAARAQPELGRRAGRLRADFGRLPISQGAPDVALARPPVSNPRLQHSRPHGQTAFGPQQKGFWATLEPCGYHSLRRRSSLPTPARDTALSTQPHSLPSLQGTRSSFPLGPRAGHEQGKLCFKDKLLQKAQSLLQHLRAASAPTDPNSKPTSSLTTSEAPVRLALLPLCGAGPG